MKKCFSLNLLSLSGFISLPFWVWAHFQDRQYVKMEHAAGMDIPETYFFILFMIFALIINIIFILILIVLAIIEKFLRKKYNLKEFKLNINDKVYSFLFYFGLTSSLLPSILMAMRFFFGINIIFYVGSLLRALCKT